MAFSKGYIPWNKGKPAWNKGLKGIVKFSDETKRKMSEASRKSINPGRWKKGDQISLGKKHSDETKKKIGEISKNRPFNPKFTTKGLVAWNKGKKMPEISGENHYLWRGGCSGGYSNDWTNTLKESIRQRDEYVCQECGIHQDEIDMGQIKKLDVHHIDYNKKNCNPENLVSLCRICHIKTNTNREYWTNYYAKTK